MTDSVLLQVFGWDGVIETRASMKVKDATVLAYSRTADFVTTVELTTNLKITALEVPKIGDACPAMIFEIRCLGDGPGAERLVLRDSVYTYPFPVSQVLWIAAYKMWRTLSENLNEILKNANRTT